MKRSPMPRSDPEKQRAWQARSKALGRTPMKRGTKPLPKKSEKQKAIDRQRPRVRAAVEERDGPICYAKRFAENHELDVRCHSPNPDRRMLELHEIVKRSRWRMGVLEPSNCRLLCQAHHDWTEAEPAAATALGLLASAPPIGYPPSP